MSYTIEQLTAIESAIASGELVVRSETGRMIEYRSMSDLIKARDVIKNALEQSGTLSKRKKYSFISRGNQ